MRYSAKTKKEFIRIFKANACNIKATCEAFGIDRSTYYDWMAKYQAFNSSVEEAKEGLIDDAESALLRNILEGNVTAQIFFLKTKGRERGYIEHHNIDHTTKGKEINSGLKEISDLAYDDLQRIKEIVQGDNP